MKRKLILSIFTFVIMFLSFITVTYAYWNVLTFTDSDSTITLGEGDTLTVSETTASSTDVLIPSLQTPTTGETTSRTYTYNVKINEEAFDAGAKNLTVTISNVKIGGSTDYVSLVNFKINETTGDLTETFTNVLSTTNYVVTIIVTLTEPADQTEYTAIINKVITFNVNFTAASA